MAVMGREEMFCVRAGSWERSSRSHTSRFPFRLQTKNTPDGGSEREQLIWVRGGARKKMKEESRGGERAHQVCWGTMLLQCTVLWNCRTSVGHHSEQCKGR